MAADIQVYQPKVIAHFDISAGQEAESIALEPNGDALIGFATAQQVARVSKSGSVEIVASLPPSSSGFVAGIDVDDDGTIYVVYSAQVNELTGLWRIRTGESPERIAALPGKGDPNGLALDDDGNAYVADSRLGKIWKVDLATRKATSWATGSALEPGTGPDAFGYGANGIKVRNGSVWVSNTDKGTISQIPINCSGGAESLKPHASGLRGIDDFQFSGKGEEIIAALHPTNEVAHVDQQGSHSIILTAADGLSNPTSVAVKGKSVYVPSAAFFTRKDPNLLRVKLGKAHHQDSSESSVDAL
jgi:streptogramin lyase